MLHQLQKNQSLFDKHYQSFDFQINIDKLESLMANLSHLIVKDGEGASKFIKISVDGAQNYKDAKSLGMSIANSPLFKTASTITVLSDAKTVGENMFHLCIILG